MKNLFKLLGRKIAAFSVAIAGVTLLAAHSCLASTGLPLPPLYLGLVDDEAQVNKTILDSLSQISKRLSRVDDVEKAAGENKVALDEFRKSFGEFQGKLMAVQRQMLSIGQARQRRGGEVSDDCAKHLAAIGLLAAVQQGKATGSAAERALGVAKSILDLDVTKSLSASEIPLPTQYAAEVVELVSEYGQARKFGTVYPLGSGTVKLPKLKTSPAFGLIALANQLGEKKPAIEFVTFSAEKWGGIIIVPNEIDEDAVIAMGQFISRYAAREMAKIEDVVFFMADGTATYASCKGVLLNQDAAATRVVMATGKTKLSDLTLANVRAMRAGVASAARGRGKYYFHPSFEQLFSSFNTGGDKPYIANGVNGASLDGFKIEWIDVLQAYSETASVSTVFGAFGDMSFSYLGVRGGLRFDLSKEFLFDTDQTAMRAIERFIPGHMATDHVAVVKTAAS